MDPKEKILKSAEQVFTRLGIKSVTMDDISRELGISKKTLYQYVTDKSDLIKQCFSLKLNSNCEAINQLHAIANPIDEVLEIMKYISVTMKRLNPMAMNEIKRFYPESWALFENYRHEYIMESVKSNMEKGMKEGYYRSNINVNILAHIHMEVITLLIGDQLSSSNEYSFHQIYIHYMEYHLRGICTSKGVKYLENRLKELSFN